MPLHPDRFFDPDPTIRKTAGILYNRVKDLPLICPHGHVEPSLLAENKAFSNPAELLVLPDHYILRMLYSQGIALESLGSARLDGALVESDGRKIWQLFGKNYYLFRGTPVAAWMDYVFSQVFSIDRVFNKKTAMDFYDEIDEKLRSPEFLPRSLYQKFNIEVLNTTDAAYDSLDHHQALVKEKWEGKMLPCFRPDSLFRISRIEWKGEIDKLAVASSRNIDSFKSYISAIEDRRAFFISQGATSTDTAVVEPCTQELSGSAREKLFQKALSGKADPHDEAQFSAHMLMEMARMSVEDGLVMQLHPGSWRNHNQDIFLRFGPDKGADIPVRTEYTQNLHALLNKYGNNPDLTFIVFTLDETVYARELAPMAAHYPAMKLGPAWWFHDSIQGMQRYREDTTEIAGFYNTVGFNDDTRAFPSIPARHDLSRRVDCNFLAGLVSRHILEMPEAEEVIMDLSYNLAKKAYRL